MALKGVNRAMTKLNSELKKLSIRTAQGLTLGGALIKLRSQAKTPVDLGNLKGSHYIETGSTPRGPVVEVGLTANYSVFVHEDLEAHHPTGQAKFLQAAINESQREIISILRKKARFI